MYPGTARLYKRLFHGVRKFARKQNGPPSKSIYCPKLNIYRRQIKFYSSMFGRGYLVNRDVGKPHFFTFGVAFGEGVVFLLRVNSCSGVDPILKLL